MERMISDEDRRAGRTGAYVIDREALTVADLNAWIEAGTRHEYRAMLMGSAFPEGRRVYVITLLWEDKRASHGSRLFALSVKATSEESMDDAAGRAWALLKARAASTEDLVTFGP